MLDISVGQFRGMLDISVGQFRGMLDISVGQFDVVFVDRYVCVGVLSINTSCDVFDHHVYLLSCNELDTLQPTVHKHAFANGTCPCIDDHLVNGRVSLGKGVEKDLTTREFTLIKIPVVSSM